MATGIKHARLILFTAILLICTLESNCGQTLEDEMVKLLGGNYWSEASSIEKTNDVGYIIVGTNNSDGIGSENLWLVKTDSNGVTKWEKTLGVPKSIGRSILRTDDDTYIIAAITELKNNTDLNAWIIKTNSAGGIDKNETVIDEHGRKQVYSILKTADNNYTLVGSTESSIIDSDIWLVRLFNNGSLNWSRSLNLNGSEIGRSAAQTKNEGYLIAGYTIPPKSKKPEILLIATDSEGKETENTNIENLSNNLTKLGLNKAYSIIKTKDGYVILGTNESLASDENTCLLVKFFENGTESWNCSFDDMGYNAARSVIETKDGAYVIVGETNSNDHGSLDAWIAKINSTGSIVWSRAIGGTGYDIGNSVLQADDGGFVIAGATGSYGNRNLNGWLVKVNSSGYDEWNTTLGLEAPPITRETKPEWLNATVTDWDAHYITPFVNAIYIFPIKPILIFIGFIGVLFLIYKLFLAPFLRTELIFEDFKNATGDDSLKDTIAGFSELLKEKVSLNLELNQSNLEKHSKELGPKDFQRPPDFCYVPSGAQAQAQTLSSLTDSLKELTPEQFKPLAPLISLLSIPYRGIKVSCILQGHKDQSDTVGISSKFTETHSNKELRVFTFWETGLVKKDTTSSSSSASLCSVASSLYSAGLFSDAVTYQEKAFRSKSLEKVTPADKEEFSKKLKEYEDALEQYEKDRKEIELRRSYNVAGKNCQKMMNLSLAKEYCYKSSFKPDDGVKEKNSMEAAWKVVLDDSLNDDKLSSYLRIAGRYNELYLFDESTEFYKNAKLLESSRHSKDAESKLNTLLETRAANLLKASKELKKIFLNSEAKNYLEMALKLSPDNSEAKGVLDSVNKEMSREKKPYGRYNNLLEPAAFWLALEIYKWSAIRAASGRYKLSKIGHINDRPKIRDALKTMNAPKIWNALKTMNALKIWDASETHSSNLAEIYLHSGTMYLGYAVKNNDSNFYRLAKRDVMEAISHVKVWYRPYILLGDLCVFRARMEESSRKLAYDAIKNYEKALIKLKDPNPIEEFSKQELSKSYIQISKAIALYSTGEIKQIELSRKVIIEAISNILTKYGEDSREDVGKKIANDLTDKREIVAESEESVEIVSTQNGERTRLDDKLIGKLECKLDDYLKFEQNARAIYNLACYLGLGNSASKPKGAKLIEDEAKAKEWAEKCLIYSLAKDRYEDTWNIVDNDPDLKDIVGTKGPITPNKLSMLLFRISEMKNSLPEESDDSYGEQLNKGIKELYDDFKKWPTAVILPNAEK